MKLIFIGPQGCGKGTQAGILSERLGVPHISTGDLFRNASGELKEELESYMNSGKLVPDELTLKILKERLEEEDARDGFILDGFPRNLNQVDLLKGVTDIDKVIEITLSDEEAVKRISGRLSCPNCKAGYNELTAPKPEVSGVCDKCDSELTRRADDTEEAVRKRLEIYHSETEPIIEAYGDKVVKINGEQSIEKIAEDIGAGLR